MLGSICAPRRAPSQAVKHQARAGKENGSDLFRGGGQIRARPTTAVGSTLEGSGSPGEHAQPSEAAVFRKPGISPINARADYLIGSTSPGGGPVGRRAAIR